jgi:hypothetical protein
MKKIDIKTPVMQKVTSIEKKRVFSWKRNFFIGISVCLLGGMIVFLNIGAILYQQQTFDLLTLFTEDGEVIREYWQDTVISFIEELPQTDVYIGLGICAVILIALLVSSHTRRVIRKKEQELQKYK